MIIVTGGAGLIGSNIVYQLNKMGREDIIIVDNLRDTEKWKNLLSLKYCDYYERDYFLEHLESLDISACTIFHLGACSSTTEKNANYLVLNNFEFSKTLFKYSKANNARFIYASSAATYGDGEFGYDDNHDCIDQLRPLNMYGYSKQMFDQWLLRNNLLKVIFEYNALRIGLSIFLLLEVEVV